MVAFHCSPGNFIGHFSLLPREFHWSLFIGAWGISLVAFHCCLGFLLGTFHCRPGYFIGSFSLLPGEFHWSLFIAPWDFYWALFIAGQGISLVAFHCSLVFSLGTFHFFGSFSLLLGILIALNNCSSFEARESHYNVYQYSKKSHDTIRWTWIGIKDWGGKSK